MRNVRTERYACVICKKKKKKKKKKKRMITQINLHISAALPDYLLFGFQE